MTSPGGVEVGRVSVRVVPNTSKFRQELAAQLRGIDTQGGGGSNDAEVNVKANMDNFRRRMLADLKTIGREIEVNIPLDVNGEHLRGEVEATMEELERTIRADIPVDAHMAAGWRQKIQAQLAYLKSLDPKVTVDVDVDRDRLGSFLGQGASGLAGMSRQLSQLGESASQAGGGFSNLSRMGWIVVAVFALAAPAIGLVAGLLAGLPSLIMAAAGAGAALYLGWEGIKRSAEGLKPAIDGLKESLSSTFEARLTPMMAQLGEVLPKMEGGLTTVANGLSDMAQGFVTAATSAQGMKQIDTILQNTGKFFSDLQPMMETATRSFLTLSEAGSQAFGYLSGSLNRYADNFDAMVNRITSSGVFDGAMKGLSQTLDGLFDMFTRLFEAGAVAMGELGGPLNTLLTGLTDFLVAAMPALTSFSAMLANVIGQLGTSLAPIITALTPAFTTLMDLIGNGLVFAFQQLSILLTPIADNLNNALLIAFQALAPVIPVVAQAIADIVTQIASYISGNGELFASLMTTLATSFANMLIALTPLLPAITSLVTEFLEKAPGLLQQLVPLFERFCNEVLPLLTQAMISLVPVVIQVMNVFANVLLTVMDLATWIADHLGPAFTILAAVVGTAMSNVWNAVQIALTIVKTVIGVWMAIIQGDWSTAWGIIEQGLYDAFDAMLDAVDNGVANIEKAVAAIPDKAKAAMGDLAGVLVSSGEALIKGFIQGMMNMIPGISTAAAAVTAAARAFFPNSPAKEGPFSGRGWVLYSGIAVGEGFAAGIRSQIGGVADAANGIMTAAQSQLKGQLSLSDVAKVTKPKSNIKTLDDETKKQIELMKLKSDEMDLEAKRLRTLANSTDDKAEKDRLKAEADALALRADELNHQIKQMEFDGKFGDGLDKAEPEMETKGLSIMEKLQRGLEKGWTGIEASLRGMADDFGDAFGVDDVTGKWDKAMEESKLPDVPANFAKATGDQFLSDLGINGNGALPQLAKQVTEVHYHVNSMDEAQADERTRQSRDAVQFLS